jgi:trans-aconitate methyltransferase
MSEDPWLDRWRQPLREACGDAPVLELGCGRGRDTAVLLAAGPPVIALDLDGACLADARHRLPTAEFHQQDLRAPFPLGGRRVGAVVASLCLHYFP